MAINNCKPIPVLAPEVIIRISGSIDRRSPDECWPWTGGVTNMGYGRLYIHKQAYLAHRLSFFMAFGRDPLSLHVCHKCDNPICCNWNHLFLGTAQDNIIDRVRKGRTASGDRNGSRTHPERLATGDRNGSKTHPERVVRGEFHFWKLHPEKMIRGQDRKQAKLTESDVVAIRQRYASGASKQSELCKEFGISTGLVSGLVNKKLWKHVP